MAIAEAIADREIVNGIDTGQEFIWQMREHVLQSQGQIGEAVEMLWDEHRTKEGSTHRTIPENALAIGFITLDGSIETVPTDIISAMSINPQWQNERTQSAPVIWLRIGESAEQAEKKLGRWRNFSLLSNDVFITTVGNEGL